MDVTMVFQNFSLFPWRTVEGNVRFAIEQRVGDRSKWNEEADRMLQLVGLCHKAKDYPHLLSGGQMQRVAFARALASRPRLMLLDEPFSALDSYTREALQEETARLFRRSGVTVVMVTHDIAEAIFMADRIAIMEPHNGHLVEDHVIAVSRPREREFRNSLEFRKLAEILGRQMHPKETGEEMGL
jgi:NitT/TauT family transport system ATP-binding protein